MKIKSNKVNYKSFFIISIALLILFLLSLGFKQRDNNKKAKSNKKEHLDLEQETILNDNYNLSDVIINKNGIIHQDSICTIYFFKELGTPTLMYDYENEASEDELFGKFKLRVVLKDLSLIHI